MCICGMNLSRNSHWFDIHGPLDRPSFIKNLTVHIRPLELLTSNRTDANDSGVTQEAAGVRTIALREGWVGVGGGGLPFL